MNEFTKEITEQLQAYIEEQAKRGHTPSMEELNMFVQKRANEQNTKPQNNFNGFTSSQMHYLVNKPFEEGCPIQLCKLKDHDIEDIPFLKQALYLMHLLKKNELKLTAQGYIPPKIVSELYEMGGGARLVF